MSDFVEIEIITGIVKSTESIVGSDEIDDEKVAYYRNEIRKNIFVLQEELLSKYSDTITKYILFPLLSYIDEKLMLIKAKLDNKISWSLLHLEYYDRKNGGEYSFEIIDNILSDNIYPLICYQSISIVLDNNFYGKYYETPYSNYYLNYKKEIQKYIEKSTEENSVNFLDNSVNSTPAVKKYNSLLRLLIRIGIPISFFSLSLLIFLSWK